MAGSDLSSGGASPPPRTPPSKPAKRKRGESGEPPSLPSRATRSSAAADKAAVGAVRMALGAVRMARRAAAGALWTGTARTGRGRGRGRGFGDVERMRAPILGVRLARSVRIPDEDDAESPYPKESARSNSRSTERVNCNISYLWIYRPKRTRTDPDEHQASVPGWEKIPSKQEVDDYKATSLQNLGTIVCPLNMDISVTDEPEKTRKEWVESCDCSHPGSEDCVLVHVQKARNSIKEQLGEEAFKNCGLDVMGEQVGELWTAVDKKKLEDVGKSIPQNEHRKFIKIALKELSDKKKKDLAKEKKDLAKEKKDLAKIKKDLGKYYYNVFLPRRLASWTRAEHNKDEDVDTDDEKSSESESDDNNEDLPPLKSKRSGYPASPKRKRNIRKYLMSEPKQRKKD